MFLAMDCTKIRFYGQSFLLTRRITAKPAQYWSLRVAKFAIFSVFLNQIKYI